MKTAEVDVVSLVDGPGQYMAGWCSYQSQLVDFPDIEIMCGGINTKSISAAGIWRQGHLLHFGFDLSPTDMNETARGMLVNSIHYIARFQGDRPTARVTSPFVGKKTTRPRATLLSWIRKGRPVDWITGSIDPDILEGVDTEDREAFASWFEKKMPYLYPVQPGQLTLDQDVAAFGVPYDSTEFLGRLVQALDGDRAAEARKLLGRYAPQGSPASSAPAPEWKKWISKNRDYLFYTDWGYRWLVDPLARKRGVPTEDLRGPARADSAAAKRTTSL